MNMELSGGIGFIFLFPCAWWCDTGSALFPAFGSSLSPRSLSSPSSSPSSSSAYSLSSRRSVVSPGYTAVSPEQRKQIETDLADRGVHPPIKWSGIPYIPIPFLFPSHSLPFSPPNSAFHHFGVDKWVVSCN